MQDNADKQLTNSYAKTYTELRNSTELLLIGKPPTQTLEPSTNGGLPHSLEHAGKRVFQGRPPQRKRNWRQRNATGTTQY